MFVIKICAFIFQFYVAATEKYNAGIKFKQNITTRKNLDAHGGTTAASVEGTTHSVRHEEKTAFTNWINK